MYSNSSWSIKLPTLPGPWFTLAPLLNQLELSFPVPVLPEYVFLREGKAML